MQLRPRWFDRHPGHHRDGATTPRPSTAGDTTGTVRLIPPPGPASLPDLPGRVMETNTKPPVPAWAIPQPHLSPVRTAVFLTYPDPPRPLAPLPGIRCYGHCGRDWTDPAAYLTVDLYRSAWRHGWAPGLSGAVWLCPRCRARYGTANTVPAVAAIEGPPMARVPQARRARRTS